MSRWLEKRRTTRTAVEIWIWSLLERLLETTYRRVRKALVLALTLWPTKSEKTFVEAKIRTKLLQRRARQNLFSEDYTKNLFSEEYDNLSSKDFDVDPLGSPPKGSTAAPSSPSTSTPSSLEKSTNGQSF